MNVDALTRYELPKEGITLLGYIVRRMHKTRWLAAAASQLRKGDQVSSLAHTAMYALTAATSFGPAYYQPQFNSRGEQVAEGDPDTGALVRAILEETSPHYLIASKVEMPDGSVCIGREQITGTTVGMRGLGMPTPSKFIYKSESYMVEINGLITSELTLHLFGGTRIRAYGFLNFHDNSGNRGSLEISRNQNIIFKINGQNWRASFSNLQMPGQS